MKILKMVVLFLGIITLMGLFFTFLALTDIYHNYEPDLKTEWAIVRIGFLLSLIFTVVSFVTIWRLSK